MCLICGHLAKVSFVDGYQRCENCKTFIAKNLPSNREVQKVLEEHAQTYILSVEESLDFITEETRLALLKTFCKPGQAVLDFGCGYGKFVKFLRNQGYEAFGYDKSENIKKHLSSGNIAFYKNINEIPESYFDVVTCFDVIEHATDPHGLIQIMKKKLRKNGVLFISTPNSRGVSAKILGKNWWVFGPTAHYILFSIFSLNLLLTKMGFKILSVSTDTLTPWFTPTEKLSSKILNKICYLVFSPFQRLFFVNYLGDNIEVMARLSE